MSHLTSETTKSAISGFIEFAKQLHYLRDETLRLIKMSNTILRALAEGIHAILSVIETELSGILRKVRQ